MPLAVLTWITGITAVANMVKAWHDSRRSGVELEIARKQVTDASEEGDYIVGEAEQKVAADLVIDEGLLVAFVEDIQAAGDRFRNCINDKRYTPAQIDQEAETARTTICTHLQKVRDFNDGQLPAAGLERMWKSWRCGEA